jgi:hypothetical protein
MDYKRHELPKMSAYDRERLKKLKAEWKEKTKNGYVYTKLVL